MAKSLDKKKETKKKPEKTLKEKRADKAAKKSWTKGSLAALFCGGSSRGKQGICVTAFAV